MDLVGVALYLATMALYARAAAAAESGLVRRNLAAATGVLIVLTYLELAPPGWTLGKFLPHDSPLAHDPLRQLAAWGVPVLAGLLLLLLLAANRRAFRQGLARRRSIPLLILYILGLLAVTQILDRIQGRMGWPHPGWERYSMEGGAYFAVGAAEESIELLIPILFYTVLWVWKRSIPAIPDAGNPGKETAKLRPG